MRRKMGNAPISKWCGTDQIKQLGNYQINLPKGKIGNS